MSTDAHEIDKSRADIGIVYALPLELAPFIKRLTRLRKIAGQGFVVRGGFWGTKRIALVEVGVGRKRAARAIDGLLAGHQPQWVVSAGFAGGLVPQLKRGDIIMADRVIDPDVQSLAIDLRIPAEELAKTPGLHVGAVATVDRLVRTVAEKKALHEKTGALAADMETSSVAGVCHERKVRFLAIRVISDTADQELPPEVESVLGSSRAYRVGAALGVLWRRPESYKSLWRLREQAHEAAERLAVFLEGIVEQLA